MIRILLCLTLILPSGLVVRAATLARYVNSSPVNSPPQPAPQIDATEFINASTFNVITPSGLPYQTLNTLFFENRGSMTLTPGYRFDFFTNNFRLGMNTWQNSGSITGTTLVLVQATNIVNS